jgi:hypothetical protein
MRQKACAPSARRVRTLPKKIADFESAMRLLGASPANVEPLMDEFRAKLASLKADLQPKQTRT